LGERVFAPVDFGDFDQFFACACHSRLERWHFPRVAAVLSVVAIAFALIGGLCSTLTSQGLDLVNSLPKYSDNIHAKWVAIQKGPSGPLNLAFTNVGLMIADLGKVSASAGGAQKLEPTKVQIVSGPDSILAVVKNSLTPVIGPIGEFSRGRCARRFSAFRARATPRSISSIDWTFPRRHHNPRGR